MSTTLLDEWTEWWSTVPPEFAFLLALPFVIAALGLWRVTRRRERGTQPPPSPARTAAPPRDRPAHQ
jgi:hypothetical protein